MSTWSGADGKRITFDPGVAEQLAVDAIRGVGGEREWWVYNPMAKVGHLRVALTEAESAALPPGCAAHDAGPSGPERSRTRS